MHRPQALTAVMATMTSATTARRRRVRWKPPGAGMYQLGSSSG